MDVRFESADWTRLLVARGYTLTHGYPPGVRELRRLWGVASLSVVHATLRRLELRGWARCGPGRYSPRAWDFWVLEADA